MLIVKFIEYLRVEKNYSKHTITAYKTDLNNFNDFLIQSGTKTKIENIDYKVIRSWIVKMVNDNISNRTINRKISSLKSFYKFLIKTDTIKSSPLIAHSPLKQSKKIQVPFSKEEINTLLDNDYFNKDYNGTLKKTIILFFYFTGVRRIELISLKSSNVNLESSTLKVIGKSEGVRRVAATNLMITSKGPIFLADTSININPKYNELGYIAILAAATLLTPSLFPITFKIGFITSG